MSEKHRRTSKCLGNISDVSKRNSDIGAKTSEILFVHSKKYEVTGASLTIPLSITQFFAEKSHIGRQGVKVVKAKSAKSQGRRACHTRVRKSSNEGVQNWSESNLAFHPT